MSLQNSSSTAHFPIAAPLVTYVVTPARNYLQNWVLTQKIDFAPGVKTRRKKKLAI